jgi:hypothetical protein
MKSITIVCDDKVGLIADISYILGKAKLNIESISVDVVNAKAIITLSLTEVEKAKTFLEAAGYPVEQINSIILKLPDQPGELNKISTILSKDSINIQKVQVLLRDGNQTILSLSTDKPKRAAKLLEPYLLNHEA